MKMLMLFAALCGVAMAVPFDSAAYMGESAPMGLVDELTTLGFTKLVELIEMAGLKETLNTGGPYTVFAPTNEAIAMLGPVNLNNMTVLVNLLKSHVIEGKVMSTMIKDNMMAPTLMKSVPMRINMVTWWQTTTIGANGAEITLFDKMAKNGVIHGIEKVIYPIPYGNMMEAMEMIPGLSFTLELIKMAGLDSTLAGEGPFTIFAPQNIAWMKVPEMNITALKANKTLLAEILSYHVAPGAFYSTVIRPGTLITTVQGQKVLFNPKMCKKEGILYMYMNEATVALADQSVNNGVMWLMDDVFAKPMVF
ncbi:uncharacterized protein LOC585177 [Strongylocentrotus purpuratus]|uniref:FAS1 domain-containing protein n=1 Tax=Strongylocentrotus purpuratus TaxID=7668 RepID=A0A7M7TH07_STRPU|nr:uncharacterized protein LOC585177 [Strongylocentrotus purpuratus]